MKLNITNELHMLWKLKTGNENWNAQGFMDQRHLNWSFKNKNILIKLRDRENILGQDSKIWKDKKNMDKYNNHKFWHIHEKCHKVWAQKIKLPMI